MKNPEDVYVLSWLEGVMQTFRKTSLLHRWGWLKQSDTYIRAEILHDAISNTGLQISLPEATRIVLKELFDDQEFWDGVREKSMILKKKSMFYADLPNQHMH